MEDWDVAPRLPEGFILLRQSRDSEDTINQYCLEHFGGDFECTLAEGKGRTGSVWVRDSTDFDDGRIMIAKKAIAQGELLFQEPMWPVFAWVCSRRLDVVVPW